MLKINLKLDRSTDHPRAADRSLVLPYGERSKSRLRATLDNGEEAGLFLERGSVLRHGDLLLAGRRPRHRGSRGTGNRLHRSHR
jgi:urease accessory protein UreE